MKRLRRHLAYMLTWGVEMGVLSFVAGQAFGTAAGLLVIVPAWIGGALIGANLTNRK